MRRPILVRASLALLAIGVGLAAVPGCGPDGSGGPQPSAGATVAGGEGAANPPAPTSNPTMPGGVDTTSRRQRQKSSK